MAVHQPSCRAQNREMIADRLGVGRTHADIDQGDPAAVGSDQVISGHLMLAPGAVGYHSGRVSRFRGYIDAACSRKSGEAAVGPLHFFAGPRSAEHTSELQSLMRISY